MSDCCATSCNTHNHPKKLPCPICGKDNIEVSVQTIMHHIKQAWQWNTRNQGYYFCENPVCDVVYFGEDNSVIPKSQVRTTVGIKENSPDTLLCYCFGVTRIDVLNNPGIKDYVIKMTKDGICSCETSNPSGRCCLKTF